MNTDINWMTIFDDVTTEEENKTYDFEEEYEEEEEEEIEDDWKWCVSTASSFMSSSWEEYFFSTYEDAKAFCKIAKDRGLTTIIVDRDSY